MEAKDIGEVLTSRRVPGSEAIPQPAIALLKAMMQLDPAKRISVDEALTFAFVN